MEFKFKDSKNYKFVLPPWLLLQGNLKIGMETGHVRIAMSTLRIGLQRGTDKQSLIVQTNQIGYQIGCPFKDEFLVRQ